MDKYKGYLKDRNKNKFNNLGAKYTDDIYIDDNSTRESIVEVNDTTFRYFLSEVYSDGNMTDTIGYLMGAVLVDDSSVFNVLVLQEEPDEEGNTTVSVRVLDGIELGTYTVNQANDFIGSTIATDPISEGYEAVQRSWWSCTKDCIGDAQYACMGNGHCAVMLMICNAMSGSGSFSIAAGCMASCTKNKNLDLLPNH